MDGNAGQVIFREEQRFRQAWVWAVILLVCGGLVVMFAWGLYRQLGQGIPWGSKGKQMSDTALLLTSLGVFVFCGLMVWLFAAMRLVVEVRHDKLLVHFRPLRRRLVDYADIAAVEVVTYRPLRHYGGWGIRRGRGGWAYNVLGNRGVRLELRRGGHLLIGSQRPQELAEAITAARQQPRA